MSEGKKTFFSADIVGAVANGMLDVIRGVTQSSWFGPGQPLPPVAPKGTEARNLDYQYGNNLFYKPKQEDYGVSFDQLRALADNYDILRLVIETRKDQVASMPWSFRPRQNQGESKQQHRKRTISDARVGQINDFFRYPDRDHDFSTWLRIALEEVFVIDALSIVPRNNVIGGMYGFDVIDGTTIKRLVDIEGRTPQPPSPAYQQILKGMPALDLWARPYNDGIEDKQVLVYRPRNPRAHKVYGFSPVEQIILTVNMALRRQVSQLSYFTEGNVPEALVSVPKEWTPQDIKAFQDMFDGLKGDLGKKSRMRFVPPLDKIVFSKEKMLMDQFDEWLARIICFCFSISPQPFTKQMNRATAQTAQEQASSEGLTPTLNYLSSVLTYLVNVWFGLDDIEHAFLNEAEADALKQAQIDKIYFSMAKVSGDELRIRDGEDPIGLGHVFMTATGPIPAGPFLNDGNPMGVGLKPAPAVMPGEEDGGEGGDNETPPDEETLKAFKAEVARLRKAKIKNS